MTKKDLKKTITANIDNECLNSSAQQETNSTDKDSFNFVKVFINHIKTVFHKFQGRNLHSINNTEFIDLGRTTEEKEQIEDMCTTVDEEYKLLAELRTSGLSPDEWIKEKGDDILKDCSPEERDEVLRMIHDDEETEVEEQSDALDSIVDNLQENQDSLKEK